MPDGRIDERIDKMYSELLDHHGETSKTLGEIDGTLKQLVARLDKQNGRVDKLEEDVTAVRGWIKYMCGGATVVVSILEYLRNK